MVRIKLPALTPKTWSILLAGVWVLVLAGGGSWMAVSLQERSTPEIIEESADVPYPAIEEAPATQAPSSKTPKPQPSSQQPPAAATPATTKTLIKLSLQGPYIGPDVAEVQQNLKDPALTAEQNKEFGLLNAEQMLKDGIDFQISQASRGTWRTDGYFAESRRRAEAAGLLFGAYHFLDAGNGAAQADYFYNILQKTGGAKGVMMMVDAEFGNDAQTVGPNIKDMTDFTTRLRQLVPGRQIIIYTYGYYWGDKNRKGFMGNPAAPEGTVLAWANYVDNNTSAPLADLLQKLIPQGPATTFYSDRQVGTWQTYMFRQFTSEAKYAQYQRQKRPAGAGQTTLDFNISYATRAELLSLAGLTAADVTQ